MARNVKKTAAPAQAADPVIVDKIDGKTALALLRSEEQQARSQSGQFVTPREFVLDKPAEMNCAHCRKVVPVTEFGIFPTAGMMEGNRELPTNEVIAVGYCPQCGNRLITNSRELRKSLGKRAGRLRMVLIAVAVVAAVGAVAFTQIRSSQRVSSMEDGIEAYRNQNYTVAVEKFQKASKLGAVEADYYLSECYRYGYGVIQNESKAEQLLDSAFENGSRNATYAKGMQAFQDYLDNGSEQALAECKELLRKSNTAEAKYRLSMLDGVDAIRNNNTEAEENAKRLLMDAARLGNVDAICERAMQVLGVEGGSVSDAVSVLNQADDLDDPRIVATRAWIDIIDNKDGDAAYVRLLKASQEGCGLADAFLGDIYYNGLVQGRDRSKDRDLAYECYARAEENGCLRGTVGRALCMALSDCSYYDPNASYQIAMRCFNCGSLDAAGCLGFDYYFGLGVMQNQDTAMQYIRIAARNGYTPALPFMADHLAGDGEMEEADVYLNRAFVLGARAEANANRFGSLRSYLGLTDNESGRHSLGTDYTITADGYAAGLALNG